MDHLHVAAEDPGDDSDEGDAVPVLRIHVRLNLEHKTRERRICRRDGAALAVAPGRTRGELEEAVEKHLHAEVVHRTAEKNWREFACMNFSDVELRAHAVEQLEVVAHSCMNVGPQRLTNGFVVDTTHVNRRTIRAAPRDAFEQMHVPVLAIVYAAEVRSVA